MTSRLVRWGALATGILLFSAALYYINFDLAVGTIRRLGVALPLALLFSGLWHLARTWAWAWCFPRPRPVSFLRLARIRLSAEAFSYLTLRGIAGEPLKVVLLADRVDARDATAAVALERLAYMVGTTLIIGIGSAAAMIGLPLTRLWFRIFRGFAIAAGIIGILTALVVWRRGTYLSSVVRRLDSLGGTSLGRGRVVRFLLDVEAHVLELVRGNPVRLVVLLTATILSYVFMALEAWVILRASGVEPAVTLNGALAVETFSRVASFASAFIPANLGALEASSLAAVAAVGAAGGGAALAVARRLRGLFWAGVGLAVYPRRTRPAHGAGQPADRDVAASRSAQSRATLLYLPGEPLTGIAPTTRLAGLPIAERVIRAAARAGYTRIIVWAPDLSSKLLRLLDTLGTSTPGLVLVSNAQAWAHEVSAAAAPHVTAIGPGTVVSPALLEAALSLRPAPGEMRDVQAGAASPLTGVVRMPVPDALDPLALSRRLQARLERAPTLPFARDLAHGTAALAVRVATPEDVRHAEATLRHASYKETDNKLARFNRRISLPISIALIRTPLTPNQLSVVLVALGFYAAWLFSLGQYWTGVLAGFLSLAASILDGCDGEIARLKYQESALGCWIETIGDYSYYIAIFVGLTVGAVGQTQIEAFYWIGGFALAGTLLSFVLLIYLRSRITAGRPERLHTIARDRFTSEPSLWSRIIWSLSFTATRSAMPYGIFAFALLDGLPVIVILAAVGANVYWISLVVKLRSLLGEDEAVTA